MFEEILYKLHIYFWPLYFHYYDLIVICLLLHYEPCLIILASIVELCDCSLFCCALLYVHSSSAIILMGKRELVAYLCLSS